MSSEQREAMEMAEDREDELLRRIKKLLSLVGSQGKCKGCGAEIWWVLHLANGTRAPYTAEGLNHFIDCPDAAQFKRKKP